MISVLTFSYGYAEISTDGTLGPQTELSGPDFQIGSDLGLIKGENLFHSFQQFSIQTGESATFQGPESGNIANIISRVTGGESSTIDGLLRSDIPGADFYLINPSGILFGPNASLDVSGSFHVSTADYLKLGEIGRFDAVSPDESLFVTAPPSAFGFTSPNPEGISLDGAFLEVPQGETISIIGGDIRQVNSTLFARSGRINIAAAGSAGEVDFKDEGTEDDGIVMDEVEERGRYDLLRNAMWESYGESGAFYGDLEASGMDDENLGGEIFISAKDGMFFQTAISSSNFGEEKSGAINIDMIGELSLLQRARIDNVTRLGDGGDIRINAGTMSLDNSAVRNLTVGDGIGGDIEITAEELKVISKNGLLYTGTGGDGDAGDIIIHSDNIEIGNSGSIFTNTYRGQGNSGDIFLNSSTLKMDNFGSIQASTNSSGDAGRVIIENAKTISLQSAAQITVSSQKESKGQGGEIYIKNAGEITLSGEAVLLDEDGNPLFDEDGNEDIYPSQIVSKAFSSGDGGRIVIDAKHIKISDGGKVNARSESKNENAGDAGSIDLTATDTIKLDDEAKIETFAENAGGGEVVMKGGSIQLLDRSEILSNVDSGEGKAGHVEMTGDSIVALNGIRINASTDEGKAGEIMMDTDVYLATDDLDLDISSNVEGNEGRIEITAPDVDISGALADLPTDYMDASQYMKSPCTALSGERVSRFVVRQRDGLPLPLDDFQPSPIILKDSHFIQLSDKTVDPVLRNALHHYEKGAWADFVKASQPIFSEMLKAPDGNPIRSMGDAPYDEYILEMGLLLARAYRYLGFHQTAEAVLMPLLPVIENRDLKKSGSFGLYPLILSELGDIRLVAGDPFLAQSYFLKSLELAQRSKDPWSLAFVMNNIANLFAVGGYTSESMAIYEQALDIIGNEKSERRSFSDDARPNVSDDGKGHDLQMARQLLHLDSENVIRLNRLRLQMLINRQYSGTGRAVHWANFSIDDPGAFLGTLQISHTFQNRTLLEEEMGDQLAILFDRIGQQKDGHDKAMNLLSLALLAWDMDALIMAEDALNKGLDMADRFKNRSIQSLLSGYKGLIHERRGEVEMAKRWIHQAILQASQCYAPEILYRWYWELGKRYRAAGKTTKAVGTLLKSMEILTPIQNEFFQGYHRKEGVFRERVKSVYLDLAGLYLALSKTQSKTKPRKSEKDPAKRNEIEALLIQAKNVLEYLKVAEIQNFFQDECIAGENRAGTLQEKYPGTAVLYPIVFPDSLKLILSFEDGIRLYEIDKDERSVYKMVRGFADRLQQPENNRFRFYARKLYEWLISPIVHDLEAHDIHTLVVAPDAILGLIPFGALFDGKQYLIEKVAISMVPGMRLTDQKRNRGEMRALACGLSSSTHGFSALPHVSRELETVDSIMGGTVLTDMLFTRKAFEENLSRASFNVLHIATHGMFGPTPDQTFLLTHDGRFTMQALRQWVLDLKFRKEPVELMTLSACQTAIGDERSALGLAGSALGSGVQSTLATLWTVDDRAAFTLVKGFYEALLKFRSGSESIEKHGAELDSVSAGDLEMTKTKALQMTQQKMLETPSFSHPFYWAAFVLIGNWL